MKKEAAVYLVTLESKGAQHPHCGACSGIRLPLFGLHVYWAGSNLSI